MEICISHTDKILDKYKGTKGSIIPIMQQVQKAYGFLPEEALQRVSDITGTRMSQLYGIATFYTQFRLKPLGKYTIRVCHGTACHVSGAEMLTEAIENELGVKTGDTTKDLTFSLESVACIGCCSLAPAMTIGEDTYARNTPAKAVKTIKKIAKGDKN
ncbi:MAG: NADH-quinone oxidoreductase subunit NuoE [Actinobacteria bacterium]|nr:MAG: NADH-quinone oxidoreductase subunit NuoE [Actinomycetota bacterium]